MTTLVGIVARKGMPGVILASDLNATSSIWTAQGDVAYRQQTKREAQKIYINDQRDSAMCMAGLYDSAFANFLLNFLDGKLNIGEAVDKQYFDELKRLNESRWDCKVPNLELINGLLLSRKCDLPKLYSCWPLGKIEERAWTSIGSGSDYALRYLAEQDKIIPGRTSIQDGIDLAVESLSRASKDIYTAGLDLVVITPEKIFDFGERIKQKLDSAKRNAIEEIRAKFK